MNEETVDSIELTDKELGDFEQVMAEMNITDEKIRKDCLEAVKEYAIPIGRAFKGFVEKVKEVDARDKENRKGEQNNEQI